MGAPLISIIMPAYNAGATIREAIMSVLAQSWSNWELLVVENACTDETTAIVSEFTDERIQLLHQPEKGVGHARNAALLRMRGSFYCFLDADDKLPTNSLADRAALLMNDPSVHFVDGVLQGFNELNEKVWLRKPTYRGPHPGAQLFTISDACFLGPTWMIRRPPGPAPLFRTDMTHAEDLFYYMSIAHLGGYDHVAQPVLMYRVGNISAMSDLEGLHRGYRQLIGAMKDLPSPPDEETRRKAWDRIRTIMWKSYLKRGRPISALSAYLESMPS